MIRSTMYVHLCVSGLGSVAYLPCLAVRILEGKTPRQTQYTQHDALEQGASRRRLAIDQSAGDDGPDIIPPHQSHRNAIFAHTGLQ